MYNLCPSFVIFYVMFLTLVKYITPLGTIILKHIKWQKLNDRMVSISYYQPITFIYFLHLIKLSYTAPNVITMLIAISYPRTFSINGNSLLDLKTGYIIVWVWKKCRFLSHVWWMLTVLICNALEILFSIWREEYLILTYQGIERII